VDGIGEEIACVCNQNYEATFRFWEPSKVGELEHERGDNSNDEANHQAPEEHNKESSNTFEQAKHFDTIACLLVSLSRFEEYDRNGVVQDSLSENNGIKLRIDFVGVENGQNRDWVSCGKCSAD
jgi:hypothetical protein